MKNSTNLGQNSLNSNANFWAKLKALFALPKWAKIFLGVLSFVAMAGLLGAFALQSWAKDKIQHGEFVLNGVDKSWQERLESGFAYDSRLYFEKADFLLRSKVIAYIDIRDISWVSPIDKNAVSELKSYNRHIKFSTSQNLSEFNGQKLGVVEYKMDFSPLLKTIVKYYLIILFAVYLGFILYKMLGIDIRKIVEFLNQNSLPQALWQGYKAIDPLYRHTFWIVFIALNLVFGFHTVQFLWGNHDWGAVLDKMGILAEACMGRYTEFLISFPLQDGMVLPFLNNIIAFAGLTLGVIWLCIYLNLEKKLWIWLVVGLLFSLQPFTLTRMYFAFQVAGIFIAFAILTLGFVVAKKAGEISNKAKSYALCFVSAFCIHWALGSYATLIDTIFMLVCVGVILALIEQDSLKNALLKFRLVIIAVILGVLSYKIVFDILKKNGKIMDFYNTQTIALNELPERIVLAFKLGFKNLIAYDAVFIPISMSVLFALFLVVFLFLFFISKLKINTKIGIMIFFVFMVLSSQTHNVIAQSYNGIAPYTDYYGIMFLRVFVLVLALKICLNFAREIIFKNVIFAISFILIWVCVVQDLYAQRVQKLGFDVELQYLNRLIDRVEANENFSYDKKYCGIMFGVAPSMRRNYYKNSHKYTSATLKDYTLITPWAPTEIFVSQMSKNVFENCGIQPEYEWKKNRIFISLISRLDKAGILDILEAYPHKNSVIIFEDIIVIVASTEMLNEIRNYAKELNKGAKK